MKKSFLKHLPLALTVATLSQAALSAGNTMETIVVTASRNAMTLDRVGSSITVIEQRDIEERGYSSLAELLRTTTGIAFSNNGGPGKAAVVRIRGEEGFRTKVLIDGVDVADQSQTQIQSEIEHIAIQDVERIEILRGPQGMMYGADSGGVINIITKRAKKSFSASLNTEYGSYDSSSSHANISGKNNVFDYVISANNESTNGFNSRKADTVLRDADGYDNTTLNSSFGLNIGDSWRLETGIRDRNADHDYDNCSFPTSHDCTSDSRQTDQRIQLQYDNDNVTQKLMVTESNTDRDYYENHAFTGQYSGENTQAQYVGTYSFDKIGTLLYGADNSEDQAGIDKQFEPNGTYERDQLGIYAEWQGLIGERFFYTAGARHDKNDDFGEHDSYRTTAAYIQPAGSAEFKYKASYGTGFRAPSLYEIAYNDLLGFAPATDNELRDEKSDGFDIGVELTLASGSSIEAIYFDQNIENAIQFDLNSFSGYVQEAGKSNSRGIELSVEQPLSDSISLFGNYTYNDTTNADDDQRIRRPRHYGNIGTRFHQNQWTLLANMGFQNDAEDEIFGTGRVPLDDRQLFDVTLSYQVSKYLELYTRAQNIFDNNYEEVTGYNTAGDIVYAGIRLTY